MAGVFVFTWDIYLHVKIITRLEMKINNEQKTIKNVKKQFMPPLKL